MLSIQANIKSGSPTSDIDQRCRSLPMDERWMPDVVSVPFSHSIDLHETEKIFNTQNLMHTSQNGCKGTNTRSEVIQEPNQVQ